MTIKWKLTLVCSLLAIIPLIAAMLILERISVTTASEALENAARNQLVSIRDTKKTQIEDYFHTIRDQALTFSNDRMIIVAMRDFSQAFREVAKGADIDNMRAGVASYYSADFASQYKKLNSSDAIDTGKLVAQLDAESVVLQYQYIQANPNPQGEKHKLDAAPGKSAYHQIHQRFHPHIRDYLEKFGYYDIFLADPETGDIVYSVYKELDYTTSLKDGSYANTGIGEAFRRANQASEPGYVTLTDFKPYTPSYEAAASFIASPIFDGDKKVGVLIFQMPLDRINAILTSNEKWKDIGLGDSGETYLVGHDFKARTMSRFLIEDKPGYLKLMQDVGMDERAAKEIDARGSNIGIQAIDTQGTRAALAGETSFEIFPDYRGVNVLSAYTPVDVLGLKWALMSEIDEEEAHRPDQELSSRITMSAVVIFLVIAVVAVAAGMFFANSITRPIIRLSNTMREVEEDSDLTCRSDVMSKDEIGMMAQAFNNMLEKFEAIIRQVSTSTTQLATASEELSAVAKDSASNVSEQSHETEQVATAMTEMNATVQEVARSAASAAEAAHSADNESRTGRTVVQQTTSAIQQLAGNVEEAAGVIQDLSQESDNIGSVLDVIKGIAEQTNLLALNAAIEAARAGEQGRGFAVVADEVRTLAQRTQESTQEIEDMIGRLQSGAQNAVSVMEQGRSQAKQGVTQAEGALQALEAIASAVTTINDMNNHIASASEQQSATTEEMNRNILNISGVAEQTAAGTRQTTAAADELSSLAIKLQDMVSQFKVQS